MLRWLIRRNLGQTLPLSRRQLGLAKYPMGRYLENPDSLNPEELAGLVFAHSGCHEPLGQELRKTLRRRRRSGERKERQERATRQQIQKNMKTEV